MSIKTKLREESIVAMSEMRAERQKLLDEYEEAKEIVFLMKSISSDENILAKLDDKMLEYKTILDEKIRKLDILIDAGKLLLGESGEANLLGAVKKMREYADIEAEAEQQRPISKLN